MESRNTGLLYSNTTPKEKFSGIDISGDGAADATIEVALVKVVDSSEIQVGTAD